MAVSLTGETITSFSSTSVQRVCVIVFTVIYLCPFSAWLKSDSSDLITQFALNLYWRTTCQNVSQTLRDENSNLILFLLSSRRSCSTFYSASCANEREACGKLSVCSKSRKSLNMPLRKWSDLFFCTSGRCAQTNVEILYAVWNFFQTLKSYQTFKTLSQIEADSAHHGKHRERRFGICSAPIELVPTSECLPSHAVFIKLNTLGQGSRRSGRCQSDVMCPRPTASTINYVTQFQVAWKEKKVEKRRLYFFQDDLCKCAVLQPKFCLPFWVASFDLRPK